MSGDRTGMTFNVKAGEYMNELEDKLDLEIRTRNAAQDDVLKLEAKVERYRQMAEHYFSPSETDRDTCRRCSLDFRDPVHIRQIQEDKQDG